MSTTDERPIKTLRNTQAQIKALLMGEMWFAIGDRDVTSIHVYSEEGSMGWTPWFQVVHGDGHTSRVNAAHVHIVEYEKEQ